MLQPFRKIKSLSEVVPAIQKRLAVVAVILCLTFAVLSVYKMVFTTFRLEG
jgi:hypothetical protein